MKGNRRIARERAELQNLTKKYWFSQNMSGAGEEGGALLSGVHDTTGGRRRPFPTLDLVGLDEIAELSGFTKRTLYVFSGREDFPPPVARIKRRLFWGRGDIDRWIKTKRIES